MVMGGNLRLDTGLSKKDQGDFLSVVFKSKSKTLLMKKTNQFKKEMGFPASSEDKESACYAGELGSIPGLGRFPGEGNGNPLQYPCLRKSHG